MSIVVKWVLKYDTENTLEITAHPTYHMMPINRMFGKSGDCQITPMTVNDVLYLCSYKPEDNDVVMVAKISPVDNQGFIDMAESDKDNMNVIAKALLKQNETVVQ